MTPRENTNSGPDSEPDAKSGKQLFISSTPRQGCEKLDRIQGINIVYEIVPRDATWRDYPMLLTNLVILKSLTKVVDHYVQMVNTQISEKSLE